MQEFRDFRDIIAAWPSRADLAEDCGVQPGTVKQWNIRNSIPCEYWVAVIDGAQMRGITGVSFEVLARFSARRADVRPTG